jgi:hypothetical protein
MIAIARSISHLSASIQYALRREQAVILDKNIVGESPAEVAKEFKFFQDFNERCKRNNFSFVPSPTIKDGQKLSQEEFQNINKSFLEKMNLQVHQYIAFVHTNTPHKHIHLYVNRIDYYGKAYNDQYISNRASDVAQTIAKEMGLTTAREIQQAKQQQKQMKHPQMARIKELANFTLEQRETRCLDKFISEFNQKGTQEGLRVQAYLNKQGNFQGLQFYAGDIKFKASEIDRNLSKQNLGNIIEKNTAIEQNRSKSRSISL